MCVCIWLSHIVFLSLYILCTKAANTYQSMFGWILRNFLFEIFKWRHSSILIFLKSGCRWWRKCPIQAQAISTICLYIYIYIYMYVCILKEVDPRRDFFFLEIIYLFCSYIRVCFRRRTCMAQGHVVDYSMRLELIYVCSLNGFRLVKFYEGRSFLLLRLYFS